MLIAEPRGTGLVFVGGNIPTPPLIEMAEDVCIS
jgi:hypothetical protein